MCEVKKQFCGNWQVSLDVCLFYITFMSEKSTDTPQQSIKTVDLFHFGIKKQKLKTVWRKNK